MPTYIHPAVLPGIRKRLEEENAARELKQAQALENLRTDLAIKQDEARQKTASQLSAAEKKQEFLLQQKKLEADRAREFQDKQFTGDMIQRARAQDYGSELNPITGQLFTPNEALAHAGMDIQKSRLPNLYGQLDTAGRAKIGLETTEPRARMEADNAISELGAKRAELQQKESEAVLAKLIAEGGQPTAEAITRTKANAELARQQGLGASAGDVGLSEGTAKAARNRFLAENPEVGITGLPAALATIAKEKETAAGKQPLTDATIENLKERTRKTKQENDIIEGAGGALGFGKPSANTASPSGATPRYNPLLYGTNTPARPASPAPDFSGPTNAPQASTVAGPQNREYGPTGPIQVSYGSAVPQGVLDPATKNALLQSILFNAGRRRNINSNLFEQ